MHQEVALDTPVQKSMEKRVVCKVSHLPRAFDAQSILSRAHSRMRHRGIGTHLIAKLEIKQARKQQSGSEQPLNACQLLNKSGALTRVVYNKNTIDFLLPEEHSGAYVSDLRRQ